MSTILWIFLNEGSKIPPENTIFRAAGAWGGGRSILVGDGSPRRRCGNRIFLLKMFEKHINNVNLSIFGTLKWTDFKCGAPHF